jgi:hypothetical protein
MVLKMCIAPSNNAALLMFKTHDLANTQTIERCTNFPCRNKIIGESGAN